MACVAASCIGAAVIAAPLAANFKAKVLPAHHDSLGRKIKYAPLASGPALQLGRAAEGEDEDCVMVTKMTGPDGHIYVTRGLVCAQ